MSVLIKIIISLSIYTLFIIGLVIAGFTIASDFILFIGAFLVGGLVNFIWMFITASITTMPADQEDLHDRTTSN